jgi:RNA 3'-terminal phosphate cyclase
MTSTSLVGNRRVLEYEGSNFLRLRLVLATLSGKPIRIRNIRAKSTMPGLTESEASLIRLFDKITNGSKLEVNETGTSLYYQPGMSSLNCMQLTYRKTFKSLENMNSLANKI